MDERHPYRPFMPLSDAGIDRAGLRRSDADWLAGARGHEAVRVLVLRGGDPLAGEGGARAGEMSDGLVWLGVPAFGLGAEQELFLGVDEDGAPVFALDLAPGFNLDTSPVAGLGAFIPFRGAVQGMSAFDSGAAATARALFEWHRAHGFCARCGAPSEVVEAGWKRQCPACGREHFPRTDPVAIMLPAREGRVLLGRQASWPRGMWSCLAGFIEPGESIEQGACRELLEEAGIRADPRSVEYLFSQPWPFPSSLMIGLLMGAETTDITVDPHELEDARWFSRDEVVMMLEERHGEAWCPPPMAVAHHILRAWVAATRA
jgi:NAD+ diphosphatase